MSKNTITFEQLDAWKQARQLTQSIYRLTRSGSLVRDYGVRDQAQRAAVSVMSNVAEGFERHHLPEKLQFYNVARASVAEVRSLSYVVEDNFPELASEAVRLRRDMERLGQLVSGLIRSTEARRTAWRSVLVAAGLLLWWFR